MAFDNAAAPMKDDKIVLENLTKEDKHPPKSKTLIKAIEKKDFGFLQEFLTYESKDQEIKNLSRAYKCKFLRLLVEFLSQPQRLEAMRTIYEMMKDTGNANTFGDIMVERSVDFNKLIFLKGKLDYLKYLRDAKDEDVVENVYNEDK